MAKSLDPQPVNFRQMYFSLPPHLADELKVRAAQERMYVKDLLTKIVTEHLENTRGKVKK